MVSDCVRCCNAPKTTETVVVEVDVPPEIEAEARERSPSDDDLETALLDHFLFEYRWKLAD